VSEYKNKQPAQDEKNPDSDNTVPVFCGIPCLLVASLIFVGLLWKFTKWAFW